jgi:hypothetical protein
MLTFEYPYLAVLVSALVAVGLGVLWYHPKCQGTRWLEARGIKTNGGTPSVFHVASSFLLWLLAACFYAFVSSLLDITSLPALISLSCLLWVAFSMPPILMGSIYTGYPFQAAAIDAAYHLGGYYMFALCFAVFGGQVVETPAFFVNP